MLHNYFFIIQMTGNKPTKHISFKETEKETPTYHNEKNEYRSIIKNILIISLAFTFLFTSFNSMANLQSSINK